MKARTQSRKLIIAGTLFSCLLAVGATTASYATPPGKNGKIAFRRYFNDAHTSGAVFTINADGGGERQVTHPRRGILDDQPDWSPDASLLVFSRCLGQGPCSLYTVRADGSRLTRLTRACTGGAKPPNCEGAFLPTFSPDGQQIAFGTFSEKRGASISIIDRRGGNRRVLVQGHEGRARVEPGEPQFSPDRKRLVFQEIRGGGEAVRALFVVNVDGTGLRRLTPWRLSAGDNPDWSPDGKWILFRSYVERDDRQSQINVVRPSGTGLKQLTHFPRGTAVTSSSFSPDGHWIVYGASGRGGNADLFVVRTDGSDVRQITRTRLWDSAPDWGPGP